MSLGCPNRPFENSITPSALRLGKPKLQRVALIGFTFGCGLFEPPIKLTPEPSINTIILLRVRSDVHAIRREITHRRCRGGSPYSARSESELSSRGLETQDARACRKGEGVRPDLAPCLTAGCMNAVGISAWVVTSPSHSQG